MRVPPRALLSREQALGVLDVAGKYYVPGLGAFLIYLVMIALLMWRPAGLFGSVREVRAFESMLPSWLLTWSQRSRA